jgi:hypothetical protein
MMKTIGKGILAGLGAIGLVIIFVAYCGLVNILVGLTVSPWLQLGILIFAIGFIIGIAWNLEKII